MSNSERDRRYMARALQLAANGRGYTSPNPMVGAVVAAPDGRIIGEGWHRRYGGPHAEVNAVASVCDADRPLLCQSTIYITLEPCSHYGKTPPCAKMLVDIGIRRVVVGSEDPNPKVAGRGLQMLRDSGIEVICGILEEECRKLNMKFMTAHRRRYPWVTLKWACSADGFLDGRFSNAVGQQIVHDRRAVADAIIVGAGTVIADRPRLSVRLTSGRSPRPIVLDRHRLLVNADIAIMKQPDVIHVTDGRTLRALLNGLYDDYGYISVLVEGGARVLRNFIDDGLWDDAYVEVSPRRIAGRVKAPALPMPPMSAIQTDDNIICEYRALQDGL